MARLIRLITKPDRLRRDQAAALRQALLPFEATLPAEPIRRLISHIARLEASHTRWFFVMIDADRNAAVVDFLAKSSRPIVALRIWALFFKNIDMLTGEIMLTRQEIAEQIGERVENVSRITTDLVNFNAIRRERHGARVRYFLNPSIGTHLTGQARDKAQAEAPQLNLRLVENTGIK